MKNPTVNNSTDLPPVAAGGLVIGPNYQPVRCWRLPSKGQMKYIKIAAAYNAGLNQGYRCARVQPSYNRRNAVNSAELTYPRVSQYRERKAFAEGVVEGASLYRRNMAMRAKFVRKPAPRDPAPVVRFPVLGVALLAA